LTSAVRHQLLRNAPTTARYGQILAKLAVRSQGRRGQGVGDVGPARHGSCIPYPTTTTQFSGYADKQRPSGLGARLRLIGAFAGIRPPSSLQPRTETYRTSLKQLRNSCTKRLGCSQAAKRPPRSNSFQKMMFDIRRSAHRRDGLDISLGNKLTPTGRSSREEARSRTPSQ
jgi:hypothetical protein